MAERADVFNVDELIDLEDGIELFKNYLVILSKISFL
jgi:hypothetical protein